MKLLGTRTGTADKDDYSFFEKNKSFFGGKREKETSLKENRGKDFLEKTGEGANSFLLEKNKKFFQKKGSLTRT